MSVIDYIRGLILRGKVTSTDATSGIQGVYAETLADDGDDAEHFQPYGLSGSVPAGAEAILLKVGGAEDHLVAVVIDDRASRPTDLEDGEVDLYAMHGQRVRLLTDGSIALIPKSGEDVVLGEQLATLSAALEVAIASKVETQLTTLKTAISGAAVGAMDGGATFKANLVAALAAWPGDTSSPNVKAKI